MSRKLQLVLLLTLLVVSIVPRVPYLDSEFIRVEEWGMPQLSNYARAYNRLGLVKTQLLPTAGYVHGETIPYVNHPPGAYLLLAGWTAATEDSERAARVLGVIFSLVTTVTLYLFAVTVFEPKTALLASFFYSFMPMSIYLGQMFTLEGLEAVIRLASMITMIHWYRSGRRSWFLATAGFLALATFVDYYPVLLAPYFLGIIIWGPNKERRLGLGALMMVPYGCLVAYILYVVATGHLDLFTAGASRHATPWQHWISLSYYWGVGERILSYIGLVPVVLSLLWAKFAKRTSEQMMWTGFILFFPFIDFIVCSQWVATHQYRVLFWMIPLALAAGHLLSQRSPLVIGACCLIFLGMAVKPTLRLYEVTHPNDPKTARLIRQHTTDDDILIGLPPSMQYYIDRPAVVPFNYLWKHQYLLEKEGALFERLHKFAKPGPGRLILFTQFLLRDQAPPDWSKTFDGIEGLKRVTEPGVDPQVWEWEGYSKPKPAE